MIIEALTNNPARTAPDLRSILEKNGGNLATRGAVAFQFTKQGVITIKSDAVDEDKLMELALEAGAEDVKNEGEVFEVITTPTAYLKVKEAIEAAKIADRGRRDHATCPTARSPIDAEQAPEAAEADRRAGRQRRRAERLPQRGDPGVGDGVSVGVSRRTETCTCGFRGRVSFQSSST